MEQDITPPEQEPVPPQSDLTETESQAPPAVSTPDLTEPAEPLPAQPSPADPAQPDPESIAYATGTYLSNPFLNVIRGLTLTLVTNPVAALLAGFTGFLIVAFAYLLLILLAGHNPGVALAGGAVVGLLYMLVLGSFYAIGGASARGETITTRQAYSRSAHKLLPLLGIFILSLILIMVGFALLVVPGIILMARLSLAAIIMFEEDLGPIKALKRSWRLTKGHTNEMLGAMFAGLFIGETYYSLLFGAINVAPSVGRYHDIRLLEEHQAPKPPTHWLNYLYIPGTLVVIGLVVLVAVSTVHSIDKSTNFTTSSSGTVNFNSNTTFSQ